MRSWNWDPISDSDSVNATITLKNKTPPKENVNVKINGLERLQRLENRNIIELKLKNQIIYAVRNQINYLPQYLFHIQPYLNYSLTDKNIINYHRWKYDRTTPSRKELFFFLFFLNGNSKNIIIDKHPAKKRNWQAN